jgi:hypothetical protein
MPVWEGKPSRTVSKRDACLRQIHGAVRMLRDGEYECAITLAGGRAAHQCAVSIFSFVRARKVSRFILRLTEFQSQRISPASTLPPISCHGATLS